ncbi:14425_t:CDS:2 [Funneliformis mosseae]|uniref:14425_t:CDS:1 n=1 Tax=Funneliformis mosseae TaxID=27381 RepID=A0A9N9B1J5_FUNMO|nr:14425_t:CDS:2 [Funneliformis mosseae]
MKNRGDFHTARNLNCCALVSGGNEVGNLRDPSIGMIVNPLNKFDDFFRMNILPPSDDVDEQLYFEDGISTDDFLFGGIG